MAEPELEMAVRARGDQVCATLRDDLDRLRRVADTDPEQWSNDDKQFARYVLCAVRGLVIEGRI